MSKSITIRVATFNVHGNTQTGGFRDSTWSQMIDSIRKLNVDILCVNEFVCLSKHPTMDQWMIEFGKQAGFMNHVFCPADFPTFGNAIYSRFPILGYVTKTVPTTISNFLAPAPSVPTRSMILACIQLSFTQSIEVACVHLEHTDESIRLGQVRQFHTFLSKTPEPVHSIGRLVCGDFNSLTMSDYSPQEWKWIQQQRTDRKWEAAQSKVTSYLSSDLGWTDLWKQSSKYSKQNRSTSHRYHPLCRIDYIWNVPIHDKSKTVLIAQQTTIDTTILTSDHFPVISILSI
jgi:endonuclease/exonuclease/phosphatase family metal-dependent hydrolase